MVLCLELSSSRHQCEIEWVGSRQVFEIQLLERPSSRNLGERLDVTTLWCNVLKYRLLMGSCIRFYTLFMYLKRVPKFPRITTLTLHTSSHLKRSLQMMES